MIEKIKELCKRIDSYFRPNPYGFYDNRIVTNYRRIEIMPAEEKTKEEDNFEKVLAMDLTNDDRAYIEDLYRQYKRYKKICGK